MLLWALLPAVVWAEVTLQRLFHIDRSQSSKIVRYDAQVEADGSLSRKAPIIAYWYRPDDEEEPTRKLNWIQRRFAYGFKARLDKATGKVAMDMVADIGRPIIVVPEQGGYRATMRIDGAVCYIDQLYIASTGGGLSTKVQYIDLRGRDVETGEERYERITP